MEKTRGTKINGTKKTDERLSSDHTRLDEIIKKWQFITKKKPRKP